jgi:hypothetical protein
LAVLVVVMVLLRNERMGGAPNRTYRDFLNP